MGASYELSSTTDTTAWVRIFTGHCGLIHSPPFLLFFFFTTGSGTGAIRLRNSGCWPGCGIKPFLEKRRAGMEPRVKMGKLGQPNTQGLGRELCTAHCYGYRVPWLRKRAKRLSDATGTVTGPLRSRVIVCESESRGVGRTHQTQRSVTSMHASLSS